MRRNLYGRKKKQKTTGRSAPEVRTKHNPFLHLRKTTAELIRDEGFGRAKTIYHAMLILNELNPTGICLFSEAAFGGAEQLTINIPSLRNFFIKGKVMSCNEVNLNAGILSSAQYKYRLELQFIFENEAERNAVRDYCNELKATFLALAA